MKVWVLTRVCNDSNQYGEYFEVKEEMAGNRNLQVIIRGHNLDADAKLIVNAVNEYARL